MDEMTQFCPDWYGLALNVAHLGAEVLPKSTDC